MPLNYPVLYKSQDARADQIVSNAVAVAIKDATTMWQNEVFDGVFPNSGFGIKRLEKFDICRGEQNTYTPFSNSWVMSIATAKTWETYIDATLSDSAYVIITGVFEFDPAPDVTAIKITADGVEYPIIDLQEVFGWDVATAYFSHPVIIRPKKKITINLRAETAGQKKFGFLGFVVGTRSYLIGKI